MPRVKRGVSDYPFNEMQIGDSFFVRGTREECKKVQQCACYASKASEKDPHPKSFVTRYLVGEGGIRIWRVPTAADDAVAIAAKREEEEREAGQSMMDPILGAGPGHN